MKKREELFGNGISNGPERQNDMEKTVIKFSPPDITEAEIQAVAEVMRSGWITTGPKTKQFEREIAEYCGAAGAVCLNSQTACAETALRILGIGAGDEVITSAYTYTASASVIAHVGAKIVLVDTLPGTLEIDYDALDAAITPATKAIIPVDIAGIPCDYDRIYAIVNSKKSLFTPSGDIQTALGRVAVVADTAHAFGAEYKGRRAGSIADFSAFSFHAVKNLTTGEGGALTWKNIEGVDNDLIYRQIQLYSLHGQNKDALAKNKAGAWEYDIVGPWYKCNMTDIMAAIGLSQLHRYEAMLARRRSVIERYDRAFAPYGIQSLTHYSGDRVSSGHLYITRIKGINAEQRNKIITEMAERGIACNVHYKPLPMMTAYKNMGFDIADFPNAYNQYVCEVTLPLHTCLTDEQVEYIIENYIEVVGGVIA